MKMFEKIKHIFSKKQNEGQSRSSRARLVGLFMLIIGNAAAISIATLAWFNMDSRKSTIDMVSGDLDVEIKTVTAYKYIYPYYANSTEFIDYDSEGVVKKFVLEDHSIEYDSVDVDDIVIASDDATVALGTKETGTTTTSSASASANNIYIPSANYVPEFRYYLVGDDIFSGVSDSWSLPAAYAFGLRESVANDKPAILDNIVVSAGSSFRLLEALEVIQAGQKTYLYNYFPLDDGINEGTSAFRVVDDDDDGAGDRLLCLRSGIYSFTYSPNSLEIELHTRDSGTRKDISVITNNSLDPTKVSIDYAGSVDKDEYPTIESYMNQAIFDQNTSLILDVELNFKNASEVDASLKIERTDADSASIFNLTNKYSDTDHNLIGYVDDSHQNMLRASDFYNFYALFTKTPYANTSAIWSAMHRVGDANSQKFINGDTYDKTIDCTLNLKELSDSTVIAANNPNSGVDNIYHCYICIDYDYEHNTYFLDKNRLGKTYLLDRDFGFHFFGVQHKEESGN